MATSCCRCSNRVPRCDRRRLQRTAGWRRAARDGDQRHADPRGRGCDRVARLHAGAPRPRLREPTRRARHLHEHPVRHRVLRPLPHRLGRPRSDDHAPRDPARRPGVPGPHADVHGIDHHAAPRRRRRHRRSRAARDERARRARRRHRDCEPADRAGRVTTDGLKGRAAIAGIGQTEFSKDSGRTELQLACEAVHAALADAGLRADDVDGLVTFTMDTTEELELVRNVGIRELSVFSRVPYGGGASAGTVMQAAMAVATGVADVVVCYRAFNERSGNRFGNMSARVGELPLWLSWYGPYGLMTPAAWVGLYARPYMERYGVTNADFGRIAVVDRAHAATNPDAWFYERPITLADHQASRWIIEPVLRLLDCCQESDGGVALVVTSAERARDLQQPAAVITAAAQGASFAGEMMPSYYRDDLTGLPEMGVVGDRLWRMSGLTPADISTAFL